MEKVDSALDRRTMGASLGIEWAILEIVTRGESLTAQAEAVESAIAKASVDHDTLLGLAVRHNLVPALASVLKHTSLFDRFAASERKHLLRTHDFTRARNAELTNEALRLADVLTAAGLKFAFTKGVVVQFMAYDGDGTRPMSDIDLMVDPACAGDVQGELFELGYAVAIHDHVSGALKPLTRERQLHYVLSPDHLPHVVRLNSNPVCPAFAVDCAMSFTWANCEWQVDLSPALGSLIPIKAAEKHGTISCPQLQTLLPSLDYGYTWLFTVLHLFREAWVHRTAIEYHPTLGQFRDVARLWARYSGAIAPLVARILEEDDVAFPVAWVCMHTDALLGTDIARSLNVSSLLSPNDLNTVLGADGQLLYWAGSIRERMRRGEAVQCFPVPQ